MAAMYGAFAYLLYDIYIYTAYRLNRVDSLARHGVFDLATANIANVYTLPATWHAKGPAKAAAKLCLAAIVQLPDGPGMLMSL